MVALSKDTSVSTNNVLVVKGNDSQPVMTAALDYYVDPATGVLVARGSESGATVSECVCWAPGSISSRCPGAVSRYGLQCPKHPRLRRCLAVSTVLPPTEPASQGAACCCATVCRDRACPHHRQPDRSHSVSFAMA